MMTSFQQTRARQSGFALVTGLVFLVVMTIIVIAALRSSTLEERMAANARNRQVALQAAEAVLREAETVINSGIAPFDPFTPSGFKADCTGGYCSKLADGEEPRWKDTGIWDSAGKTFASSASDLLGVSAQPRYIIEVEAYPDPSAPGTKCNAVLYRVTSRGQGMDNAAVLVQTMFRHRPNSC